MLCTASKRVRRQKLAPRSFPHNACAARPVGKAEIARTPAAQEAARKEWGRLRGKYVWGEANPHERGDVVADARKRKETAHMGYLFGTRVEKNSESSDPSKRNYKY
eukprot:13870423-Alexandrium_andersonii.AAC.1